MQRKFWIILTSTLKKNSSMHKAYFSFQRKLIHFCLNAWFWQNNAFYRCISLILRSHVTFTLKVYCTTNIAISIPWSTLTFNSDLCLFVLISYFLSRQKCTIWWKRKKKINYIWILNLIWLKSLTKKECYYISSMNFLNLRI